MKIEQGMRALVTGANGGLGQAIARALHRAGAKVIVTGRRADALKGIADELQAETIVADLSSRDDVARCVKEAGDVDILVANAALPSSGPLLEFTEAQIDRALDVNLRVPIVMARLLGEGMVRRKRGHMVFISSVSGMVAAPSTSMYSATKFGMRGFALALREDLRGTGVGASTIFPGFIRDAGMFADSGVKLPAAAGTRSPEDVARAVVRAIQGDRAEIIVAAVEQRFGAFLAGFSPGLVSAIQRMSGGEKIAKQLVDAQAHKR